MGIQIIGTRVEGHTLIVESRFSLNMNVLDASRTPRVMGLRTVLREWLDHRHVVLQRRATHRLAAIAKRLEILDGYLIVYLNLDEVIRIVREEERPPLIFHFGCAGMGGRQKAFV